MLSIIQQQLNDTHLCLPPQMMSVVMTGRTSAISVQLIVSSAAGSENEPVDWIPTTPQQFMP